MSAEPARRDRVLVVDDTPDTLALLTDALEEAGMTVLVALDGESAIERAQRVLPDIILLDAVMPGLDGFETCARLKASPAVASIPVVFMTGLTETEHVVRGFRAGGVDYVTKPIVPEELIARIRAHLANARLVASRQDALDLTGRALFALGRDGTIEWRTPEAARLLHALQPDPERRARLPASISDPLLATLAHPTTQLRRVPPLAVQVHGGQVMLRPIGRTGTDEVLVAVEAAGEDGSDTRLRSRFGLTAREAEVLLWIARGKSNRDIGEILGLSPRTVNKHLEHIYVKLGVENRASAAGVALGVLSERSP
jgi:DNA-binding response OmpR family regulator/DNA-binding CsgD family transcriptional regulator